MSAISPRREEPPTNTEQDERITTQESDENTPLLSRDDREDDVEEQQPTTSRPSRSSAISSLLRSIRGNASAKLPHRQRWPSFLALSVLCIVGIVILIGGFFAPEAAQEFSTQAIRFEPSRLSIDSFSQTGVNARIQGQVVVDASRVERKFARDFGRFLTWIVGSAEAGHTLVIVSLPEYGDVLFGTADVPPIGIGLKDGQVTDIDFVTHAQMGEKDALRRLANDWIDGRLGDLRIKAEADIPIKTGFLQLAPRPFEHELLLEGSKIPSMPAYTIKTLNFTEVALPTGARGIAAEVCLRVENPYPVDFQIPPLGFAILVDNCLPTDPHIMIADATTHTIKVKPHRDVSLGVTGFARNLPDTLLAECPGSSESPFDNLLANYLRGQEAVVYVQGSDAPSLSTPKWVTELMHGVTVPVSVPAHPLNNLIKNFTMQDVRFSLPDFFGEPGTPAAQPKISAKVDAIVALPQEMNFGVDVQRIRSNATIYYKKEELGVLNLQKWHPARSRKITLPHESHPDLEVTSDIENAPLFITNSELFEDVVAALITGEDLNMTVKASVDVEVQTALGEFVAHRIPAKGKVPVKPIGRGHGRLPDYKSFAPKIGDLKIVETTASSMTLLALANFTNPTSYSADIPYFDIHIWVNNTVVGHATVRDVAIKPGRNINVAVAAVWEPGRLNGTIGAAVGREALSQYLSGYNLTLTMKTHSDSIPSQPALGEALSNFAFSLPAPDLGGSDPNEPGDGTKRHFIKDATFHFFTSTATFVLDSPLKHTPLTMTTIDATAFYRNDSVGRIYYDEPLEIPPGESETPRLPVEWDLDSLGYDAIKKAIGGQLKLSAFARVDVQIGNWRERVWYKGGGIGVKVRL